ncbi:MAG: SulP family inorganic anion transporter [Planctomyces sp.]|nr:SulP family inorganic anion transporter [Planctomyces sp.]
MSAASDGERRRARLPCLDWIAGYQPAWLRADAVAGLTLAAYAIPVSMAYATLAGLPAHHGIYCYLFGGLCYAVLGTSRQLAIGPTSAIAMLVGSSIAEMPNVEASSQLAIASLAALMVGIVCGLAWLLRLSGLVNFISETVLLGFKAGAALTIGMTQLPKLFGVEGGGERFFDRLWILARQLPETNVWVLALGLAALALLVLGDRRFPGRPIALVVAAAATALLSMTALEDVGVATVGALPSGLPELRVPSLRPRDVDGVLPLAISCFLLAYIEGVSAARALAVRHAARIDPRQELLALGAANVAAAFGQGFPVAGGLSQSAVNDKAGARTPLALVIASGALALCLAWLTELIANLPTVILAAIVLVAVRGLFNVAGLKELWRVSRREFWIAILALSGVLVFGILKGVLLASIASLLMLLAGASQPHVAVLGRIPGTSRYSDLARHPENERLASVMVLRPEASLLYFNAEHVHREALRHIDADPGLRLAICDLSDAPIVDVAGAKMLLSLHSELARRSLGLRVIGAHGGVRDMLRAVDADGRLGEMGRRITLEQFLQNESPLPSAAAQSAGPRSAGLVDSPADGSTAR